MESAREAERDVFVASVLRMLPRIYIAASDLRRDDIAMSDAYVANALDEDYYEAVRMRVAELLGEDDTYLEVFENDMKYSDTPIGASVSEGLADLFQVFYSLIRLHRADGPRSIAGTDCRTCAGASRRFRQLLEPDAVQCAPCPQ